MKKHTSNYHLSRDSQARKALFKGLIRSLIQKEKITTTTTKAAATRPIFEKLLTKAKIGTVAKIREIHAFLGDNTLVSQLVHEIAPRYKDVVGGYTKIVRYGTRRGDNATMVIWSLTKQKALSAPKKETEKEVKEAVVAKPKKESVKKATVSLRSLKSEAGKANTVKLAPSRAGKRGDK